VFKNRLLRRLLGFKRDELTDDWRKLHNKELHVLSWNIGLEWVCITEEEMRNAYKILVRKAEGKRPLGTPTRRWQLSIKMSLK
jgi:hypothetical protein